MVFGVVVIGVVVIGVVVILTSLHTSLTIALDVFRSFSSV